MDKKEHDTLQEAFRKFTKKLLLSKQESIEFLIRAGILDSKGNLSKAYTSAK